MAIFHAKSAAVLVGVSDFSGVLSSVRIGVNNPTPPATAFADTDETYVEGQASFEIDHNGMFNTASPAYDGEMFTNLTGVIRPVGVYPEGFGSAGNLGYEGEASPRSQDRQSRVSEVLLLNVSWRGDKPLVTTEVLYRSSALTASATSASRQIGSLSATQEMVCVYRVITTPSGGSPTLDAVLRSDDASDMVGNTTRHTFSQTTTSRDFQVARVAGAITDTWWDIDFTITGTTPSYDVVVTIGIGPKAG